MTRLLLIFCLVVGAFDAQAVYQFRYANPTGSGAQDGLTPASAWAAKDTRALNGGAGWCAPDHILVLAPGVYDPKGVGAHGNFQFWNTAMQSTTFGHEFIVICSNQAAAIFAYGTNGGIIASTSSGFETPFVKFINLQICSNTVDGLAVCSNSAVIGCWIHHNSQQGINSSNQHSWGNLFDSNLLEYNGTDTVSNPGHYHNIYVFGMGNTFRNNVSRYAISGRNIQFYTAYPTATPGTNNLIYNNLAYGSTGFAQANDQWNGVLNENTLVLDQEGDNYVFNNTFDSWVIEGGTPHWTNNIIFDDVGRQPIQIGGYGHINLKCDYNLGTNAFPAGFAGAHDTTTTWPGIGFVNAPNGLYWLSSGSVARGKSLSGVAGPVDFFSNPESSHVDSGFVVFKPILAGDIRVLDPDNGITFPNYWQALSAVSRIMQATALHVGLTKFGP